jgi:hypothetical protein
MVVFMIMMMIASYQRVVRRTGFTMQPRLALNSDLPASVFWCWDDSHVSPHTAS